ncbi:hypothetical protein [Xanthomonas sp. NCPPB 2632]|jgi:hypothetical protein|uniref:hypothetical protein n=1 Tax=Xanthomonas sp. NCPPB 2632 TaxID=3240912 RepID=UPI0035167A5D
MKTTLAALVLIVAGASAHAVDARQLTTPDNAPRNAPVCPDGQVAEFVGVINGKATWRCVPA